MTPPGPLEEAALARVDLLAATQRLAEEKGRIESELPQLRQQLAYKSQQLASLEG